MKYLYLSIILGCIALLSACSPQKNNSNQTEAAPAPTFPPALEKVFEAHGGLANWKSMAALTFGIERDEGVEMNYVNLWDRRDRIDGSNFKMGYNGNEVWLEADTSYKGNAIFYHNLMFYFYAMPFILADDGIIYSETEDLVFEGKSYPGIHIGYETGIGASDLDEYILYYDPDTHQMAWLGYTATYFSKERKKTFNKIRYDDWGNYQGILLPNSISWYKVEEGKITEPRNRVNFTDIKLNTKPHEDQVFEITESGKIVEE